MYPQIKDADVIKKDVHGQVNAVRAALILQKFYRNLITKYIIGGASGVTVTSQLFRAPAKMIITKVSVLVDVPNAGADNIPTVNLKNGSTVVATGTLPLSGAAGDVVALTLSATAANLVLAIGDILSVEFVTPSSTVDTAVVAKLQIEHYFNNN